MSTVVQIRFGEIVVDESSLPEYMRVILDIEQKMQVLKPAVDGGFIDGPTQVHTAVTWVVGAGELEDECDKD